MSELDNSLSGANLAEVYNDACASVSKGTQFVVQRKQKIQAFGKLFYTSVEVNNMVDLRGMLDSGSMACSISKLLFCYCVTRKALTCEIFCFDWLWWSLDMTGMHLYVTHFLVPTLFLPIQEDHLILGSNVIKQIIHVLKGNDDYCNNASSHGGLRICTDFRWLNARTLKNADCLTALGGNCLFSTMDLTSCFF